ncbi:MAG: hypothetical protein JXP34_03070 [Planctomycetes bacterium]|nr:hypothetical protein [Planctomycetota bacterium]
MRVVHAFAIGLLASSPAAGRDGRSSNLAPDLAFDRHIVRSNVPGADEVACGDIDGDGRTDIVGCNFAERDNPLEVWIRRK